MRESEVHFGGTSRFRIRRRIGAGAMGVVYEAHDCGRDNPVALKYLRCIDPAAIYRFKREFRALADVSHRNLVCLHELVSTGRDWFFTMELIRGCDFLTYVRGASLDAQPTFTDTPVTPDARPITATGSRTSDTISLPSPTWPLPGGGSDFAGHGFARQRSAPTPTQPDFARLRCALPQLVEGVWALHQAGHLHRDIKPSNIMVEPSGRVVVLDFGVATELSPHNDCDATVLVGTPFYMAPEQCSGDPLTEACDMYAVGVVLFEALTGQRPFAGNSREVMAAKQQRRAPSPRVFNPCLPEDLCALCDELLDRDPTRRPSGKALLSRIVQTEQRPVALHSAGESSAAEAVMVGREAELDALNNALTATRAGATRLVVISGGPGAGRSVLLHQFVARVAAPHNALVLGGRCFEREFVPYKAIDSVVDALSTYLLTLPAEEVARLLPHDLAALGQLFPVLRRLGPTTPALVPIPVAITPDPHEQRRRGIRALRELLRRLAQRSPLVLCVDDVQWGGIDSALLLAEVMRGPDPPAMLVIVTCPAEEVSTSVFLATLLPHMVEFEQLEIRPLSPTESTRMAQQLFDEVGFDDDGQAAIIARESRGNPLFVARLVWFAIRGGHTMRLEAREHPLSLEEVVCAQVAELPAGARALLEVVAIAGRPTRRAIASQAAMISDGHEHLTRLRVARLVRSSGRIDDDTIVTYHDRIRKIIVANLPEATLRQHHDGLARAIETSSEVDPEVLARHYRHAGRRARAGHFATLAGDNAFEALAFQRAADNYRRALELAELTPGEATALRAKLGAALANARWSRTPP